MYDPSLVCLSPADYQMVAMVYIEMYGAYHIIWLSGIDTAKTTQSIFTTAWLPEVQNVVEI